MFDWTLVSEARVGNKLREKIIGSDKENIAKDQIFINFLYDVVESYTRKLEIPLVWAQFLRKKKIIQITIKNLIKKPKEIVFEIKMSEKGNGNITIIRKLININKFWHVQRISFLYIMTRSGYFLM